MVQQDEIDLLLGELTTAPRRASSASPARPLRPRKTRPPSSAPSVPAPPDWSLDGDADLQDFLHRGGYRTTARGQSDTHNRLGYDHRNAADIGVHPSSPEGVRLVNYLSERGVPFQAFTRAAPGTATAPHIHIGAPSGRTGARFAPGTTLRSARRAANDVDSLLDEVADTAAQPTAFDDVDSLLNELTGADDEVIRTETATNRAGHRLDPRTRQPTPDRSAAASRSLPAAHAREINIHTSSGRAERDRARALENASSAFRTVDVQLPSGQTDWSEVSSRALVWQATRQLAAERNIPSDFVESWLQQHGANTHLQDAAGRAVNPIDVVGTEHYDGERRTIRVGAELPAFKRMEADYQASRGTTQRVSDWATDDARTAGEKFMDVAGPTVEGAAHALDIATRPVQAASTGFWATARGKSPDEIARAMKEEFLTGRTVEGAENWIAEQLRHSDRLKAVNPNLPGMLGELANMIADPVNLLPVMPFTRLGSRALRATRTGGRIMEGLEGARDSFAASRLGGDGNILRIAEATDDVPVPESAATLAAQMQALQAGRRPVVLVTPGEATPRIPEGFTTTETTQGLFIHDPRVVTGDEIARRVSTNTHGELLGHVEPRSARTTQAIVARDPRTGAELQASYVSPENVQAQAAEFQRQFPEARIEAGGAEVEARVLQDRARANTEVMPQPSGEYGSANRLVSRERADAARARLKARLSTNRVNDLTELGGSLGDVLELSTFHVEAGARTFADFSARMIEDAGERIKPHLGELYDNAQRRVRDSSATGAEEPAIARTPLPTVISSIRKAGLLTGIKTHARNLGGNTVFQIAEEAARVPASIADLALSAVTRNRTVAGANPRAAFRSSREAATRGVREAREIMRRGATREEMRALQLGDGEMNSGSSILDTYTNGVFRLMSAGDRLFRTFAARRSLEDQARVIALNEVRRGRMPRGEVGARTQELVRSPTEDMSAQALSDAEFAVFANDNFVTTNITGAVRDRLRASGTRGAWANAGIDMILPFDRTPTNIIARVLEYSGGLPASLASLGYKGAAAKIAGRAFTPSDQRAFARTFGRGSTGAAAITLGYTLAASDLLTGLYDNEQDERGRNNVQRAAGRSAMAIRVGDTWHQIGQFSPLGNLLSIGATIYRERHQPLKDEQDRVGRIADIAGDVVIEQPLLGAMQDLMSDGTAGEKAGRLAGSFVPQIVADAGAMIDNQAREARGFTGQVMNRVPGLRSRLPEATDVFGRPVEQRRSAAADPTLTRTRREGAVERELLRLNVGVGTLKKQPDESLAQFRARRQRDGARLYETLTELVTSEDYRSLTEAEQRKTLDQTIRRARAQMTRERAREERE